MRVTRGGYKTLNFEVLDTRRLGKVNTGAYIDVWIHFVCDPQEDCAFCVLATIK